MFNVFSETKWQKQKSNEIWKPIYFQDTLFNCWIFVTLIFVVRFKTVYRPYFSVNLLTLTMSFWRVRLYCRDICDEEDRTVSYFDDALQLQKPSAFTSATQKKISVTRSELVEDVKTHLSSMRSTYLAAATVAQSTLQKSRFLFCALCLLKFKL